MNPLTQIKNTQKASKLEISQGFSESASWHARFKHSAYVFAGGLPYDLTEGDVLAIFSQYGELVDINLVKDKDTGERLPNMRSIALSAAAGRCRARLIRGSGCIAARRLHSWVIETDFWPRCAPGCDLWTPTPLEGGHAL